jgi:hypothetical protein
VGGQGRKELTGAGFCHEKDSRDMYSFAGGVCVL